MSIAPHCDKCKQEVAVCGTIELCSEEYKTGTKKFNVCETCYDEIRELID